jgi:hypothetical protein
MIVSGVVSSISVELPLFTCNPRQDTAFDRAEVSADQNTPRCGADHRPGTVAHDGKRPWI